MMTIREYKRAESLEEAWQLNQKRPNRVLGGMIWLKMENINVGTAIDLSGLGLDTIEETDEGFSIGAMVTLRQLELHPGLAAYTDGAVRESVRHIVGVQFRNLATVGGSIYGRYGFSDVLTMFLAMDSYVELGLRPFLELGFMPYKLASGSQTVFYWKGNVTPPASYEGWSNLIKALIEHLSSRYGSDEVVT